MPGIYLLIGSIAKVLSKNNIDVHQMLKNAFL